MSFKRTNRERNLRVILVVLASFSIGGGLMISLPAIRVVVIQAPPRYVSCGFTLVLSPSHPSFYSSARHTSFANAMVGGYVVSMMVSGWELAFWSHIALFFGNHFASCGGHSI